MNVCFLFHVTLLLVSLCEGVQIELRNPIPEGEELIVTCTSDSGGSGGNTLSINGQIFGGTGMVNSSGIHFNVGTISRSNANDVYRCDDPFDGTNTESSPLVVWYLPELSVQPNVVESSLTGTAVFNYTVDANPPPSRPVVFRDGEQVVDGITVSDTNITFSDIRCSDNGTYTLWSNNTVGDGNFTHSLLVMRSRPIWLVKRIFEDPIVKNLSAVVIACPEELLNVSCVFSDYTVSGVQFTTTFNATAMTLELLITSDAMENTVTVTANAICTASNQEGGTPSGMFTVRRTISGPVFTLGAEVIAGIVIGSIAGVTIIVILTAIIIGICCYCLKKRKP